MVFRLDDLNAPLGVPAPGSERKHRPIALVPLVMLSAIVGVVVFWSALKSDPLGGEPHAVVPLESDNHHTTRSEVAVIGVKSLIQNLSDEPAADLSAASLPGTKPTANPADLIEDSRMGPLPKVAADGTRPLDAYAQPLSHPIGAAPRIAIVVGGLGLSQTATLAALDKLPGGFTLAFSPYGASLQRWTTRARNEGHELLLQIPMEPYDFPDNDPGPQSILTSLDARQNIERLQWDMTRITGYVGVVNDMGARATANADTMRPVLGEIAKRGLMYLDDGSSSRSLVGGMAPDLHLPFVSAAVDLDAVPTPDEIDARLSRLETAARTNGSAVGIATNLPITVDRLSEWAKSLEPRGLALVPISLTLPPPSSTPSSTVTSPSSADGPAPAAEAAPDAGANANEHH